MKIPGHPLHLMLIHFPSALFPVDLLYSVLANYIWTVPLIYASSLMTLSGTAFGWIAAITGMFDLSTVAKNRPGSVKKAMIHGFINTIVLMGYTVLSFLILKHQPEFVKDSLTIQMTKACLVALMIGGNFIGGSLVLEDKVLDKNN